MGSLIQRWLGPPGLESLGVYCDSALKAGLLVSIPPMQSLQDYNVIFLEKVEN